MSGTWKGVDKPGGAHYQAPGGNYASLTDCPACKYGTLERCPDGSVWCIDCKKRFTVAELRALGAKLPPR